MTPARMHRAVAALVFFLQQKPRTRAELTQLMGWEPRPNRASQQRLASMLAALVEEGLITETIGPTPPTGGRHPYLYTWIPVPQPTTQEPSDA